MRTQGIDNVCNGVETSRFAGGLGPPCDAQGSLVLEVRSHIKTDEEESTIKVTGICRPEDVTAANTILSNQLHDLKIEKMHEGELKKANEKGIIAKVLDTIFAF